MSTWIPTSERYPDEGPLNAVLFVVNGSVHYGWRWNDGTWECEPRGFDDRDVTHWMPLPEPPTPEIKPFKPEPVSQEMAEFQKAIVDQIAIPERPKCYGKYYETLTCGNCKHSPRMGGDCRANSPVPF